MSFPRGNRLLDALPGEDCERLFPSARVVTLESRCAPLGTRRAGVSVAAATLQGHGAIEYTRGNVTIRDLALLAQDACECYETCRAAMEETLARPGGA